MYIKGHSSYQLAYDVSGQNVDPRSEEILRENFQSFMTQLCCYTLDKSDKSLNLCSYASHVIIVGVLNSNLL